MNGGEATEPCEERFSLLDMGTGSGSVDIGPVVGKRLRVGAEGYGILKEGGRSHFSVDQSWRDTRITRWGPGVQFGG